MNMPNRQRKRQCGGKFDVQKLLAKMVWSFIGLGINTWDLGRI